MIATLRRNWWAIVLRGVFAIAFGVFAFLWPKSTLLALTLVFGAYALLDGVFSIVAAVRASEAGAHWWGLVFEGVAGILAAAAAVLIPGITLLFLVLVIGAWSIVTGILEIVVATRVRRHITNEWLLALAGVCSILFGLLLFLTPAVGAVVLAGWIGAYAVIFGILLVAVGLRVRHRPVLRALPV